MKYSNSIFLILKVHKQEFFKILSTKNLNLGYPQTYRWSSKVNDHKIISRVLRQLLYKNDSYSPKPIYERK